MMPTRPNTSHIPHLPHTNLPIMQAIASSCGTWLWELLGVRWGGGGAAESPDGPMTGLDTAVGAPPKNRGFDGPCAGAGL